MIFYSDIDLDKGFILAEKLRLLIKESEDLKKYKLTASIGIGISKPGLPLDQLIKNVDSALYQAKNSGRDQTIKVS